MPAGDSVISATADRILCAAAVLLAVQMVILDMTVINVSLPSCASCHGDDARGSTETGAPNLTDKVWIYGGDAQTIATTAWSGRQGHMPTWEGRLSRLDRKILALYVFDMRRANP